MNNPSKIKKSQQHYYYSSFGLTEFSFSWGIGSVPLCTLPLRFRVVLVDPCFITCDDTAQNVILLLQKVLANRDPSLLLFFGGLFWDHFCTHSHVKIFSYDFPNCFSVDVYLLCYAPESADDFRAKLDEFLQCFLQFCLLLAVLISLHQ